MPKWKYLIYLLIYKTTHGNIHALENVEFQLEDGESIGIAGESACGKSTLGLTIIRMLQGGEINSGKSHSMGNPSLRCLTPNLIKIYVGKKFPWSFKVL